MKRALVLGGVVAALASAAPAAAQTTIGWDAALFSSYVWRGLSLTNKPVLQPNAYLSFPLGSASLTLGGWANVDLGSYDGTDDISQGGGTSFNLSEFDPYAEIGVSAGKATLTAGGVGYIYPNDDNVPANPDVNTVEVYGKVDLDVPFSPGVAAYYDVDKVKGLYVEGYLSRGIPLGATELTLGALAGFSAGQGPKAGELNNFDDDGLTHLDLSAEVSFNAGPFSVTPTVHLIIGNDEFVKFTDANSQSDAKLWGGVTLSWSKAFGGEAEE
jgi:hypothetical protein